MSLWSSITFVLIDVFWIGKMKVKLNWFPIITGWQKFTLSGLTPLVIYKMNILCKNQEVSMCQSRDIAWNTRKYRQISQNLRTLAIIFKIPWQNFTKTSESLVLLYTMSILCKNQEVSMCQSRDITWNTRKYREISQNLRTLAIIFKSPWQNFTKTSESLVYIIKSDFLFVVCPLRTIYGHRKGAHVHLEGWKHGNREVRLNMACTQ